MRITKSDTKMYSEQTLLGKMAPIDLLDGCNKVSICKEKNAVSVKHRIVKQTEMRHACTYILVQALRYPSSYVHIFSNSHLIIIAQH